MLSGNNVRGAPRGFLGKIFRRSCCKSCISYIVRSGVYALAKTFQSTSRPRTPFNRRETDTPPNLPITYKRSTINSVPLPGTYWFVENSC